MGGEISSAYGPVFTLHKNAARKRAATLMLAKSKMMITLISWLIFAVKISAGGLKITDEHHACF
jgi:hypothetical protein